MTTRTRPVSGATEATLRRLEVTVTRRLDGLLHGDHLGLLPGNGTELADGRLYTAGDDVRRIDWNLTARSGTTHVRDTVADRELETWLIVDCSASLDFGTADCEKRDLAAAAAAAFGFLTSRAGNRLGGVLFDGSASEVLPPQAGRTATLAVLRRLQDRSCVEADGAPLSDAIRRAWLVSRRRGLLVVISDFIDRGPWARELRAAAARHDVVAAHITDPRDTQLPPVGLLTLVDPETGRRIEVQTANHRTRTLFASAAAEQQHAIRQSIVTSGATRLHLSTDRDWLLDVVHYLAARRRRR